MSRLPFPPAQQTPAPDEGGGRAIWLMPGLSALLVICFLLSLTFGAVHIPVQEVLRILSGQEAARPAWGIILLDFRLPKALTAVLAGCALSVSGLQMQTLFRNSLADPYILGVSSGASLGVALLLLNVGTSGSFLLAGLDLSGDLSVAAAASIGAALSLGVILSVARRGRSVLQLLILGIMFSYITGALVSLLFYFSIPERVQAYLAWSFGSFGGVTWSEMKVMAPVLLTGLAAAFALAKPLDAFLLGETYARSMGLHTRRARLWILFSTSLLAGVVTAFCGPVAFLGLAVPHLCRGILRTSNHRRLIPAVCVLGAILALLADWVSQLPGSAVLPLNAVTALLGAPVVIWVLLRQHQWKGAGLP